MLVFWNMAIVRNGVLGKMPIFSDDNGVSRCGGSNKPKTQQQQQQHKEIQHSHHHHNHHNNQHHHNLHNQQSNANKSDSSDTNGHHHHHARTHQQHQHQQQHQQQHHHQQASSKHRRSRNRQRQDENPNNCNKNNNTNNNNNNKYCSNRFPMDDWLNNNGAAGAVERNLMYCYDRRYIASCVEDNHLLPRSGGNIHRDSTSSDVVGSDDLNSSSSNEDLSTVMTYNVIQKNNGKKNAKSSRQNRQQQKRKQLAAANSGNRESTPMDVDEDTKENHHPIVNGCLTNAQNGKAAATSNTNNVNLRKQSALKMHNKQTTKAASRKNHNNNINALSNSASVSSVCSTLSSSSSTLSLPSSMSSSASSSPSNSLNCSPTASPTASKRTTENFKKIVRALAPPLRQHAKLNFNEGELVQHLRRYVIDANLLRVYGYPVESAIHEGCIEIYKCLPKPYAMHTHHHNINATASFHQSYQNAMHGSNVINVNDGLIASSGKQWTLHGVMEDQSSSDSGQGSGDSSPPSVDSDSSEVGEGEDESTGATACYTPDGSYQIFSQYDQSLEKQCVRCKRNFHVTTSGEYISRESCVFHWGKLNHMYTCNNGFGYQYSCCQGDQNTEGCTQNPLHVWTGAVVGLNGPYTDFVHTQPRRYDGRGERRHPKVYALDCEMSFTGRGLEVTKVTVVGYDGQLMYEHFVRPHAEIVDYNTRFSGITERDLCTHLNNTVKTLPEVQRDLLQIFDADTILIGHGIDNDLRVLRIVHKTIIDTSIAFPHASGFPYRRALKHLTKVYLNRDIQMSDAGHSSFEDSRACLELMLWKVRKDLRHQYTST